VNTGSRVRTPVGDGRVIRLDIDENWTFGKPNRRQWILVQLDTGTRRMFSSSDVEELDEIEWPE
jgi:hypothetical protein